jgi:hypothetical protein
MQSIDSSDQLLRKAALKIVGIATGYGLDDWGSGVGSIPGRAGNFSLLYRAQTDSGEHRASYPMGTEGSFPGGKAAGA